MSAEAETSKRRVYRGRVYHGLTESSVYQIWKLMMRRCHRPANAREAADYRDRGITVCDRWHNVANFLADMGERPPGKQLDRIDNDKGYEPGNCRRVSWGEQQRNKRTTHLLTFRGKTQCLLDWANEMGINRMTLLKRVQAGWSTEDALTRSVRKQPWRQRK
jgi:hypothetical protein